MENKQINFNLKTKDLDDFVNVFVESNVREFTLEQCKLTLRAVDEIQDAIANTTIAQNDRTYYSACINSYTSIVRERIYNIISFGL